MIPKPYQHVLPEHKDNPFIVGLPPPLAPRDAYHALSEAPRFYEAERLYAAHLRIECVRRLDSFFVPLLMHLQLESDLGGLIRRGYVTRNPLTTNYMTRLHEGYQRINSKKEDMPRSEVESTASSFAMVGCSGIGKTKTVARILNMYKQTIAHTKPFRFMQIVWLKLVDSA